MKKIILLFWVCFSFAYALSITQKTESEKKVFIEEAYNRMRLEQVKLKERVDKIEQDEKRYEDAKEYYKETVKTVSNHFNFIQIFATLFIAVTGYLSWKDRQKIVKEIESLKIAKEEIKLDLEENKFYTKFGLAVSLNSKLEKHEEFKKLAVDYRNDDKKLEQIYDYVARFCASSNNEIILYCDKVLLINPNNQRILFRRGEAYKNLQQYELAKKDYNKIIEINDNSDTIYNWVQLSLVDRIICNSNLNNFKEVLEDSLRLTPENVSRISSWIEKAKQEIQGV